MEGRVSNDIDLLTKNAFQLFPVDELTNNRSLFVPKTSLSSFQIIGLLEALATQREVAWRLGSSVLHPTCRGEAAKGHGDPQGPFCISRFRHQSPSVSSSPRQQTRCSRWVNYGPSDTSQCKFLHITCGVESSPSRRPLQNRPPSGICGANGLAPQLQSSWLSTLPRSLLKGYS